MNILSSTVNMNSSHQSIQRHTLRVQLQVQTGTPRAVRDALGDSVSISEQARARLQADRTARTGDGAAWLSSPQGKAVILLKMMVERMTGQEIRLLQWDGQTVEPVIGEAGVMQSVPSSIFDYQVHEQYYEGETTTFTASGTIVTSDGESIQFQLDLSLSRQYLHESSLRISNAPELQDPLVINFAVASAQLSQRRLAFDLEASGDKVWISPLAPGSGFLALDRNQDGMVNDGMELFGALSGDGFAELARYDEDGNGWIDANDAVFGRLSLWHWDEQGKSKLTPVADLGIVAIHLQRIYTPFTLADPTNNQALGRLASTGIYLHDDKQVGTVQQLDLVVTR